MFAWVVSEHYLLKPIFSTIRCPSGSHIIVIYIDNFFI